MADNPKIKIVDPTCRHVARGWVSWPPVMQIKIGSPHASAYCCERVGCVEDAALWVEAHTGHRGVFEPFSGQKGKK